jgi:hypothetical protein
MGVESVPYTGLQSGIRIQGVPERAMLTLGEGGMATNPQIRPRSRRRGTSGR